MVPVPCLEPGLVPAGPGWIIREFPACPLHGGWLMCWIVCFGKMRQLLLLATREPQAGLTWVVLLHPWGVRLAPVRAGRKTVEAGLHCPVFSSRLTA